MQPFYTSGRWKDLQIMGTCAVPSDGAMPRTSSPDRSPIAYLVPLGAFSCILSSIVCLFILSKPPKSGPLWPSADRPWPKPIPIPRILWTEPDGENRLDSVAAGYQLEHQKTDRQREAFLLKHFPAAFAAAFGSLVHSEHRAELWRYCMLYRSGGVWLDSDVAVLKPLATTFAASTATYDWYAVVNAARDRIVTSILATPPRNTMMLELAERIVSHVPECNAQPQWASTDFWRVVKDRYGVGGAGGIGVGASGPAIHGAGSYLVNGSTLTLLQERCAGNNDPTFSNGYNAFCHGNHLCCTVEAAASFDNSTVRAPAVPEVEEGRRTPLFRVPNHRRGPQRAAASWSAKEKAALRNSVIMRLVVRGEIFRVGNMLSRDTSGSAATQLQIFSSVRSYVMEPLMRLGWIVHAYADVSCDKERHSEARALLLKAGFLPSETRLTQLIRQKSQTQSWLSTISWLRSLSTSSSSASSGSSSQSFDLIVVRADALFKREVPLNGWLTDPGHAPDSIIAPWYVGRTFGQPYKNFSSDHKYSHLLRVPAVCDALLFVRSTQLGGFVDALRAMSKVGDYLTKNSMHFLPWYSRVLVTTLWAMPPHDSNPAKEWNPLYSLPGRKVSDRLAGPWILSR